VDDELVWESDIMPLNVVVKPFGPYPNTVCKVSEAHLFVVDPTRKPAIRPALPCLIDGTGFQIGDQLHLLARGEPARTNQAGRLG
jgi:hypothetical protein